MSDLLKLPNIGPILENQLKQVGINTYEDLKSIGSKESWLKIQAIDSSACINRLNALEGAIQKIKKAELSNEKKMELKEFYNKHKLK